LGVDAEDRRKLREEPDPESDELTRLEIEIAEQQTKLAAVFKQIRKWDSQPKAKAGRTR
jgi:hypothetical protein